MKNPNQLDINIGPWRFSASGCFAIAALVIVVLALVGTYIWISLL